MLFLGPRNGEVILKDTNLLWHECSTKFQSPQWGSNSKDYDPNEYDFDCWFQSPQWGSNSKGL